MEGGREGENWSKRERGRAEEGWREVGKDRMLFSQGKGNREEQIKRSGEVRGQGTEESETVREEDMKENMESKQQKSEEMK